MNRKIPAMFCCSSYEGIEKVYTEEQRRELGDLVALREPVLNKENFRSFELEDVEILFSTWGMPVFDDEMHERMPGLKILFYAAGATDNFAHSFLSRGIKIVSAWQANAIPVAEFTLAQILLSMKGAYRNNREYISPETCNAWRGPGVYGEKLTILGDGAIAYTLLELLKPFKLDVTMIPSRPWLRSKSFEEAFAESMVVSNHLPNREDNRGVLTGAMFESMRHGATFINTGRGAQVAENEMIDVLMHRPDLTAILDVTDPEPPVAGSPLYTLPNVLLYTHIAGSINDEIKRLPAYMTGELKRYLNGEALLYEVTEDILITSNK